MSNDDFVFCGFSKVQCKTLEGTPFHFQVLTPMSMSRGTRAEATRYKAKINEVTTILGNVYPMELVLK